MTEPLTFTPDQAAALLGDSFTADWLRHHIKELPHARTGSGTGRAGKICFTRAHLERIVALREVLPEPKPTRVGPVSRRRAS